MADELTDEVMTAARKLSQELGIPLEKAAELYVYSHITRCVDEMVSKGELETDGEYYWKPGNKPPHRRKAE